MYLAISSYEGVDNPEDWKNCPVCGLKPLVWVYDNGRSTACGCGKNMYDHFSIHAESITSVYSRTGKVVEYKIDELKDNWNHWVSTGEVRFKVGNGKW